MRKRAKYSKEALWFIIVLTIFTFLSISKSVKGLSTQPGVYTSDDQLSWLTKVPQMEHCFRGDCRLTKDIERQTQTKPGLSADLTFLRWREAHCLLDVYTPLYTLGLLTIQKVGGTSIEMSFFIMALAGAIFLSGVIGWFFLSFYGFRAGTLALGFVLLNSALFSQWTSITPSTLCTGIFVFFVTAFFLELSWFGAILPIASAVLITFHPLGKLFAVILVLLFTIRHWSKIRSRQAPFHSMLTALIIVGAYSALGLFLDHPHFRAAEISLNFEPAWSYRSLLMAQLVSALESISQVIAPVYEGTNILFHILALGPMLVLISVRLQTRREQMSTRGRLTLILVVCLVLSLFHVMVNYPAELFKRILILLSLFLAGGFGLLVTRLSETRYGSATMVGIILLVGQAIFTGHLWQPLFGSAKSPTAALTFNPQQVKKLFNPDGRCGSVLYMDPNPLWFYSVNGALPCGAIVPYYWSRQDPELADLIRERTDLTHLVMANPVYKIKEEPLMTEGQNVRIQAKAQIHGPLWARFAGVDSANKISVAMLPADKQSPTNFDLSADQTWVKILGEGESTTELVLQSVSGKVALLGLSFDQKLNWPWGKPLVLTFPPLSGQAPVSIDFEKLASMLNVFFKEYALAPQIVDDSGASMLVLLSGGQNGSSKER